MSENFKVIETQEELDRIIQDRLNRQKEKFADYDELKTRNAELETKIGALQTTIEESGNATKNHEQVVADLNAKIASYETTSLRTKIALQNGLPLDLADRVIGDDEASMKADAERLAAFVGKQQTPPPLKNTEKPIVTDEDADLREMLHKLNERGE